MLNTLRATAGIIALALATPVAAENVVQAGFVDDIGQSERMNFSGKLRMLSQRIPGTACYAHANIEKEKSSALLEAAMTEFDQIIYALEHGDESLGIIGPEEDRKVLAGIAKMHSLWDPLHPEIIDVYENGGTDEEVVHLAAASHEVLDIAKRLVVAIVAEHSDPTAVLQTDAMTIDIAGRQRMLAQRISKNACLIMTGLDTGGAIDEMAGAREIYDASVNALRFGMPEAGINASDNPAVIEGLDKVLALWKDVQPILDSVAAGEDIADEQRAYLYNSMNSLTGQMNTLVGIYTEDAKLNL